MIELTNETQNIMIDCQIALDWEVYYNGIGVLMDNGEVLKHEPWASDEFTFTFVDD